jgi:protein-S-isoprenylcysteine O-methyltransferase Ste14
MLELTIIVLSVIGFLGFLGLDTSLLRQSVFGRILVTLTAVASLTAALILTFNAGDSLGLAPNTRWIGIILIIVGGCLTTYSTLLEIPLAMRHSPSSDDTAIYKHGTYALCRHPGFLWLILDLTGLVVVFNRFSTLVMAICWISMNFFVILIQDRIIFPHRFPAYKDYQRTIPFLIPTPTSIRTLFKASVDER